jgi:DNA-binding winged helix-turn-helix (wHTH) protein/tetratricopeptide (TPR) repeat protein
MGSVVDGAFRLGSWLVEPGVNRVSRNGTSTQLEPKVMAFLVCLAAHAPEPVPKEKLLQEVWPNTFVSEGVLTRSIHELRQVFQDEAKEPRVIETIAKGGYRLVVPVTRASRVVFAPLAAQSARPVHQRPGDRVAVFPLANPDGSPDTEYLLSGIPGSIIRGLSPLPGLTVVAGGVVPGDGSREENAEAFGRKFSVGTALLGRLLQRRTKLRLQVDLVDTKTGEALWADQFDRDFAELFLVEDAIVNEVSKQLRLNLREEDARLRKRYTENAEAYQFYLRGRYWCESRTAEGFTKGVEYFKNAIQTDPQYALAYAQLAVGLYTPGYYGHCRPQDNFPAARAFAAKALELDDSLAEAHEALASLNTFDWRWADAEEEYRRSLEINPNHALSHFHYSMCLAEVGRYREAVSEAIEAQVRDPLSGVLNAGLAWTLWAAREYDKCVEQSRTATELDPNSLFSRIAAGVSYEQNEMYRESIAEFQEGINRHGGPMFLGFQGHALARSGDKASAWDNIHRMEELSKTTFVTPAYLALTYAGLEENDLAIRSLQAAYENRDTFLVFTRLLPQFDNLRSDPRFGDLLRRMNFPS